MWTEWGEGGGGGRGVRSGIIFDFDYSNIGNQ